MAKRKPNPTVVKTLLRASWRGVAEAFDLVWSEVIEQMLILYFPPVDEGGEEDMAEYSAIALKGYVADLAEFSRDVLAQGWTRVRRSHPRQSWPTIQAVRSACQEEAALAMPAKQVNRDGNAGPTARYDAAADACMRTDFGRKAIREGWGWDLYCHVRDHGEVPTDGRTLNRLKTAPDRAMAAVAGMAPSNPLYSTLRGFHEGIIRKNDWLAGRYLSDRHREAA